MKKVLMFLLLGLLMFSPSSFAESKYVYIMDCTVGPVYVDILSINQIDESTDQDTMIGYDCVIGVKLNDAGQYNFKEKMLSPQPIKYLVFPISFRELNGALYKCNSVYYGFTADNTRYTLDVRGTEENTYINVSEEYEFRMMFEKVNQTYMKWSDSQ